MQVFESLNSTRVYISDGWNERDAIRQILVMFTSYASVYKKIKFKIDSRAISTMTKWTFVTSGPRFMDPSSTVSYSRSLVKENNMIKQIIKTDKVYVIYPNKELIVLPVFDVTYISKIDWSINPDNHNSIVCVCFRILLRVSVDSSAR